MSASLVVQLSRGDQIAALSFVAAVAALAISVWQWFVNGRRGRQMATLEFWTTTQDLRFALRGEGGVPHENGEEFDDWIAPLNRHYEELSKGRPSDLSPELVQRDHTLRQYLGLMETMGTGVNCGLFDLVVVRRLDGPRIEALWTKVGDYVGYRRGVHDPLKYRELELLVDRLRGSKGPRTVAAST